MGIIERTETRLVIQSRPWLEWLVGGLFVAGGLWPLLSGEPIFGGAFMLAGAVIIVVFANTVTSRFDRATGRFTQSTKGLVRGKEIAHSLDEIVSVRVDATGGSANSPSQSYKVVLPLRSRERVTVPSGTGSGKADKEQLAAEIRAFLSLPDPPEDPPGFSEMIGGMLDAAKAAKSRQAQRDRR